MFAGNENLKIGIIISPPSQYFKESKSFLSHTHGHWDTIASDYRHLANYAIRLPRLETERSAVRPKDEEGDNGGGCVFRLTKSCLSSLANDAAVVNENWRCACGLDYGEVSLTQHCVLPREVEIENFLIPYKKTFDSRRTHDLVFHCWTRAHTYAGDMPAPGAPRFGSRLCVRRVNTFLMEEEHDCPDNDMRRVMKYKTKARPLGCLHHVVVQDIVRSLPRYRTLSDRSQCWRIETRTRRQDEYTDETVPRKQCKSRKLLSRFGVKDSSQHGVHANGNNAVEVNTDNNGNTVRRTLPINAGYPPDVEGSIKDEMERRLRFGRVYNAYTRAPKYPSTKDRWDNGYWKVEARRMGNLPRWKSRYTTHIPMEFPGLTSLTLFDLEVTTTATRAIESLYERVENALKPYLTYNNATVLPASYRLCFGGETVFSENNTDEMRSVQRPSTISTTAKKQHQRKLNMAENRVRQPHRRSKYSPASRLCTLRLPVLLPPALEEAGCDTYRRSVLYNHAMHMVITKADTVWTGDVRYKPALATYHSLTTWKETPLKEIKLKPGVYKWTPFQLGVKTTYGEYDHLKKFLHGCSDCYLLYNSCEYASTMVQNDDTPHYYLMNTTLTDREHDSCRREVFESVPPAKLNGTDFDRLVHIWACDREEFLNCGVDMPFNWWNRVDGHLEPIKMWWPTTKQRRPFALEVPVTGDLDPEKTPLFKNNVELRHQLLGNATKLVVKNPATFFNRSLISVEICSGGAKAGGYTLLDENSLEVVGAVLLDERGNDRLVYECHRHTGYDNEHETGFVDGSCFHQYAGRDGHRDESMLHDEPAVGVHFVPYSYQQALLRYGSLAKHLVSIHNTTKQKRKRSGNKYKSRIEECFGCGTAEYFTPHDFNIRPSDVVNAKRPFETTRKIVDVKDKALGPLQIYTVIKCDPYDRLWYGKLDGTPRDKLSDVMCQIE